MPTGPLTDSQVRDYHRDGYVLARGMFDSEEIRLISQAAREDRALDQHSFGRADGEGGTVRLSLWNHPGDTIYGMFARCESVVNSAEKLLGRRGLPLPLQDDHEGRARRRRVGVAPGLRLLVSERRPVPAAVQRLHRGRPGHARERLPAGDPRLASTSAASTTSSPATRPARTRSAWTKR